MKSGQTSLSENFSNKASSSKRYAKTAHNLPQRNLKFIGRQEILERLQEKLKLEGQSATAQIVAAIDGIGKTQVAKEYAYQSLEKGNYRLIGWLDASKPDGLALQFLALADALEIDPNLNSEERKDAVLQNLKRESGWLLIFDDAPDYRSLLPYYPQGKGHVLVTSQNINELSNQAIILNIFNREESTKYILKGIEGESIGELLSKDADTLAELLADLPLALSLAVAYLRETKIGINEYIHLFETQRELLPKNEKLSKDFYALVLKITFDISFEVAQKERSMAVSIFLNYLGHLHHQNISWMILEKLIIDEFVLDDIIFALSRYALIEVDTDQQIVNLHKAIQLCVRDKVNNPKLMIGCVSTILHDCMNPVDSNTLSERVKRWVYFMLQSKAAIDYAKEIKAKPEIIGNLFYGMGFYCHHIGEHKKAFDYYDQALTTSNQLLGEQHPDVGLCLNDIGALHYVQGEYSKALKCLEQSLKIRRRVLDGNHPDIATTLNNLGLVCNSQGHNQQALRYFKESLEIKFKVLDRKDPSIATTLNCIGGIYSSQRDYAEALKYYERSLEIRGEVLEEENPDLARSLHNVGSICGELGDYEKALKYCLRALTIRRQVFGENHPEVAASLYSMGMIYESQGSYKEALEFCDQALKIMSQTVGNEHPDFGTMLNSVAMIHRHQGNHQMALTCLEQVLIIFQKKLGPNHPYTMDVEEGISIVQNELNPRSNCAIQ